MNISKERSLLVCYNFIKRLKKLYGSKYTIYTDLWRELYRHK